MCHIWESTLPCCDDAHAPTNHVASLTSDAHSEEMRAPYLEVHMCLPFCLFGHVTPHGPIRDALDGYTSQPHVDLAM